MTFEWDDEKNKINIKKHGISFKTATLVFGDMNRLEFYDELNSFYEYRFITLGWVEDVLMVVYTVRDTKCRIISARPANSAERRRYYDGI